VEHFSKKTTTPSSFGLWTVVVYDMCEGHTMDDDATSVKYDAVLAGDTLSLML
jgi:hypothetical protein